MGKIIRNGIEFSSTVDTANNIKYDNSLSKLEATTTQKAIDEVNGKVGQLASNQIPEEYLKIAVDEYVNENNAGFATQTDFNHLSSGIEELNEMIINNMVSSVEVKKGYVTYDRKTGKINITVDNETGEARFYLNFDKGNLERAYLNVEGYSQTTKTSPILTFAWLHGADNIGTGNIYIDGIYEIDFSKLTGERRYYIIVTENIDCYMYINENTDMHVNELNALKKDIASNTKGIKGFFDSFSINKITPNFIKNGILYPNGVFVGTSTHNTIIYHVSPNSLVHIKAKKVDFNGVLYATYQFQTTPSISTVSPTNIVGSTVCGEVDEVVEVPSKAYYLAISVKIDDSESGLYPNHDELQIEKILRYSNATIMTCFDNNLKLNIMMSSDGGKTFETFKLNVFEDENGGTLRDPSIVRYKGKYVLAYSRHGTAVGNTFGLCVSDDLIHWYSKPNITLDGMSYVWAPELFVDNDVLYCTVGLSSTKTSDLSLYMLSTTDLINWTTPIIMDFDENEIHTCFDGFIMKANEKYNLFVKDSTYPPSSIVIYQSDTIDGHYIKLETNLRESIKDTDDEYGTSGYYEGGSVIELPNGKFRLFVDNYAREKYYYLDSSDLITWSKKAEVKREVKMRHGTAFNFMN